jgi:hypothetical protein
VQEVDQLLDPVLRRLRKRPPASPAP